MSQIDPNNRQANFGGSSEMVRGEPCGRNPQQQPQEQVRQVELYGERIVALIINGRERLCLAQISNSLLRQFSYNEIHNRRVALGITCVQCTPIQLELLRRAGAMPSSSRRCGMITMREAQRLCKSFLFDEQAPELPENFYFSVAHRINYGCRGRFVPARYISSRAKCIECFYCGEFFSPNKFIFHSHRQPDAGPNECNPPDSPNINSWRKHIDLDPNAPSGGGSPNTSQDVKYAWEDVKSLFNGGTRRRTSGTTAPSATGATHSVAHPSSAQNNNHHNLASKEHNRLVDVEGDGAGSTSDASELDLEGDPQSVAVTTAMAPGPPTRLARTSVAQKRRHPASASQHQHPHTRLSGEQHQSAAKRPAFMPPRATGNSFGQAHSNLGPTGQIGHPNLPLDQLVGLCPSSIKGSLARLSSEYNCVASQTLGNSGPKLDVPVAPSFAMANNNIYTQQPQQQHHQQQHPASSYSQLYTQLARQHSMPTNPSLETQLALTRHQFWSSLLANLQQHSYNQPAPSDPPSANQNSSSIADNMLIRPPSSMVANNPPQQIHAQPQAQQFNPHTSCSTGQLPTSASMSMSPFEANDLESHTLQSGALESANQLGHLLNVTQLYRNHMTLASKLQVAQQQNQQHNLGCQSTASTTTMMSPTTTPSVAAPTHLNTSNMNQLDSSCSPSSSSSSSSSTSSFSSPSSSASALRLSLPMARHPAPMVDPANTPLNGHKFASAEATMGSTNHNETQFTH